MTSINSAIIWMFLTISSSWSQCVTETHDDTKFSINVTEHIEVESIECILIPHIMKFPPDKVSVPYKKMLFQTDPSNIVAKINVMEDGSDSEGFFKMNELPPGQYEFGFILEWGCNQTYIFSKRVHVSVTASTVKPIILFSEMVAGQIEELPCLYSHSCSDEIRVHWKWTKADGSSKLFNNVHYNDPWKLGGQTEILFHPTADDHNTNITCVVEYKHNVVETTVTLTVEFPPKILKDSHCVLKGKLLVCMCISWGNPLPPITWPLQTLTDYFITSSSSNQTVSSTITFPAAEYQNTTVKCISSNKLGRDDTDLLIQNSTEEMSLTNEKTGFEAALPWMTAACFSLNLVFITILIICLYQRKRIKQKELFEETNTYASLRKTEVEEDYSVVSPQPK